MLFAISFFFGQAKSTFCVTGRLSSELAAFAVLLAASWTERAPLDLADCTASFLGAAREKAKTTTKMPCCTAAEAGHPVLKKKAL